MENQTAVANTNNGIARQETPFAAIKSYFSAEGVKQKFTELLGKKAQGFITSVLQVVSSNDYLSKASPTSIYQAAAVAATLDLPINNNLGFAYIVPYGKEATFQMGYRGYIQLAQRSGQFKTIAAAPIYEGQLVEQNPLTGYKFDFTKKTSDKVIGYAAYFSLINGFEKTHYMTVEELQRHGKKFSQTFKKGGGLWATDFDSMAQKTVLKLLLAKFAPLSIEMQKAVIADQAVVKDADNNEVDYVDGGTAEEVIDFEDLELLYQMKKDAIPAEEFESCQRIIEGKEERSYAKLHKYLMAL